MEIGAWTWEVGEDEVNGQPAWRLAGVSSREGVEVHVTQWFDKETLLTVKTQAEVEGMVFTSVVAEFRPEDELSPDLFRLPPGARVLTRSPRSPEAGAIMARVLEDLDGLSSFYCAKLVRVGGSETEVLTWYGAPYLREERTVRLRFPGTDILGIGPVQVSLWDMEEGVHYVQSGGRWEAMESVRVPPAARGFAAVNQAFNLSADRFIAVAEGELDGRPVWVVTGETLQFLSGTTAEPLVRPRWWVDRETYRVLQYEQPIRVVYPGRTQLEVGVGRILEFRPGAQVPLGKVAVPEGMPVERRPEPVVEPPLEPGERLAQGVAWEPYSTAAQGQPVVLYSSADWCEPCHALEEHVFRDSRVVEALDPFVRLKADLSDWRDRGAQAAAAHRARTLPTLVFFDQDGREIGRVVGYSPAVVAEVLAVARGGKR